MDPDARAMRALRTRDAIKMSPMPYAAARYMPCRACRHAAFTRHTYAMPCARARHDVDMERRAYWGSRHVTPSLARLNERCHTPANAERAGALLPLALRARAEPEARVYAAYAAKMKARRRTREAARAHMSHILWLCSAEGEKEGGRRLGSMAAAGEGICMLWQACYRQQAGPQQVAVSRCKTSQRRQLCYGAELANCVEEPIW